MKNLSRRQFLGTSALGIGSALLASQFPLTGCSGSGKGILPAGFQVWTIREQLIQDFAGTLKMMAGMGYKTLEMCSPPGYEGAGFGPLMSMKASEMKKIITDAGLTCYSSHYGLGELRDNLQERMDFALESGQTQMILSSFWLPENSGMDEWMKAADELNEIGAKTKKSGLVTGFHNHHMEFEKIDGILIYDALLERLDPDVVKMQFQVAVIDRGYKAADYFRKYPGRFISAHLADWSAEKNDQVPIGQGIVDWKEFFSLAETAGLKNIFVEMDPVTFKESAEFLNSGV